MIQWLRIRLPMQETGLRSLILEDSTYLGATKPVCYTTEPAHQSPRTTTTKACAPQQERSHGSKKPEHGN